MEDFETELGGLLNKWLAKVGLDNVCEALAFFLQTFELRQDTAPETSGPSLTEEYS